MVVFHHAGNERGVVGRVDGHGRHGYGGEPQESCHFFVKQCETLAKLPIQSFRCLLISGTRKRTGACRVVRWSHTWAVPPSLFTVRNWNPILKR